MNPNVIIYRGYQIDPVKAVGEDWPVVPRQEAEHFRIYPADLDREALDGLPKTIEEAFDLVDEDITLRGGPDGTFLMLPMTAIDNAVLQQTPDTPDIEWRSAPGDRLWIGVEGLHLYIGHNDEGVSIDVYDKPAEEEAIASAWAFFPID